MATREVQGSAYPSRGKFFAQVALGAGKRKGVLCPLACCVDAKCDHRRSADGSSTCAGLNEARHRSGLASELVAMLRDAKQDEWIEKTIKAVAELPTEKLPDARKYVEAIVGGRRAPGANAPLGGAFAGVVTFEKFAEQLTSGKLRKVFPDHVDEVAADTMQDYASTLRDYVHPTIGPLPITTIGLDQCLEVMRLVPEGLSSSRRRRIAFIMRRVLALAAFPARIIASNPIPEGFLPKLDAPRARGFIFPDEEAQLLAAQATPLQHRVLYGLLAREGMRKEEAASLEYGDQRKAGAAGWVDLDRGWVYLDRNKTDDARDWPLSPDVAEALRRWRKLSPKSRLVFPSSEDRAQRMNVEHLADDFRAHLIAAGIDRPELFEDSEDRRNIVAHDIRAVFVTTSLAQGRSEQWIQTRTGHTTSTMLARYRRRAASLGEGDRAKLAPMHEAIPELRTVCGPSAAPPNGGERATETHENNASPSLVGGRETLGSSAARHRGSTPRRRTTR